MRRTSRCILITCAPAKGQVEGLGKLDDQRDSEEAERVRVGQVVTLLAPHVARWRYLRVYTQHASALPVPTIDFAGYAPLLNELHLRAALPVCTPVGMPDISANGGAFRAPHLNVLTMDLRAFSAAGLYEPGALPALSGLILWGRGMGDGDKHVCAPPTMSVRTLLRCAGQMQSLRTLWLDGVHLELDEYHATSSTSLQHVTRLRCECLSRGMLRAVLGLATGGRPWYTNGGENPVHELEIVECKAPFMPMVQLYTRIELVRMTADDIFDFLMEATECKQLSVVECPGLLEFLEDLSPPEVDWGCWRLPELQELSVKDCVGVEGRTLQALMRERPLAARDSGEVEELTCVVLDGHAIDVGCDNDGKE